jgi:chitodextrinase
MKITQTISNKPTRITLTASADFVFKLKNADIYMLSAYIGAGVDEAAIRALFDEVSILDVPKYNGALMQQTVILAAAGVQTEAAAPETPDDATPEWTAGQFVKAGEARKSGDDYYRCVQGHVTQADWPPSGAPALWARIAMPAADGTPPAWVQPTGAHDAYAAGARVSYNGKTYKSAVDANVYAPGVVAGQWLELSPLSPLFPS